MRRIFAEFLAGNGLFLIAEGLTRDGVASPSAHDPARTRHRSGIAWSKSGALADPADKAEVYRQLGLRLTYHPDTQKVYAQADLGAHRWDLVRVRGTTRTITPWPTVLDFAVLLD